MLALRQRRRDAGARGLKGDAEGADSKGSQECARIYDGVAPGRAVWAGRTDDAGRARRLGGRRLGLPDPSRPGQPAAGRHPLAVGRLGQPDDRCLPHGRPHPSPPRAAAHARSETPGIARTDPDLRRPRSPCLAADPLPPRSHARRHRPDLPPDGTARRGGSRRHPDQRRRTPAPSPTPKRPSCARADRTCVRCCAVRRRPPNTRSNWRRNPNGCRSPQPLVSRRGPRTAPTRRTDTPLLNRTRNCGTSGRCWLLSPRV